MPVPGVVNDGDFSRALQNGAPSFEFPFFDKGDPRTFIATVPMRQDGPSYTRPIQMSQRIFPGQGKGYLVNVTPPTAVAGSSLVDFNFIYASLPNHREEYGQATYEVQLLQKGSRDYVGYTDLFDATYVYDYSLNDPLPGLFRGKLIRGVLDLDQGPRLITSGPFTATNMANPGARLVQNSTTKIWMGKIYERLSIYTRPPTASTLPFTAL